MKQKQFIYFLIVIGLIVGISQLVIHTKPPRFTNNHSIEQHKSACPPFKRSLEHEERKRASFVGFVVLVTLAISASYGYAYQYNKREKDLKELENEQFASELLLLKSQINPHFLFNVFNSIYSLSLKKSDDLPKIILKLSDLLRYVTYESEEKFVNISQELAYIQNYIDLQKLRLAKESVIHFSIKGNNENVKVAPMLFITFIENVFKHGLSSEGEIHMECSIVITNSSIDFLCVNTFAHSQQKDAIKGIGIQNVKRRLELLYPQKHTLQIQETASKFSVNLALNVS